MSEKSYTVFNKTAKPMSLIDDLIRDSQSALLELHKKPCEPMPFARLNRLLRLKNSQVEAQNTLKTAIKSIQK